MVLRLIIILTTTLVALAKPLPKQDQAKIQQFRKNVTQFTNKKLALKVRLNAAVKAMTLFEQIKIPQTKKRARQVLKNKNVRLQQLRNIKKFAPTFQQLEKQINNYNQQLPTIPLITSIIQKQQQLIPLYKQAANQLLASKGLSIEQLKKILEELKKPQKPSQPEKPQKNGFKIITLTTPNRMVFSDLTAINQQKYAQQHRYDFMRYTHSLAPERPEEWSKIQALLEKMKTEKKADWLLWIDDDIVITNPEITLDSFVAKYGKDKNLIIAKDAHYLRGTPINNGIFLIKNSAWAKEFLNEVWKEGARRGYLKRGQSHLEQQTMTELIAEKPIYKNRTIVINQRELNSFLRSQPHYRDPIESIWQPGDFAAHVTGMPIEFRTQIIKDLIKQGDKPMNAPRTDYVW